MFTLIRTKNWRDLFVGEGPTLIFALALSELFFKFHSFILESVAFLAVWYAAGALVWAGRKTLSLERE